MSTKANEVVVDALGLIDVHADEAPIEQSDSRTAIRLLNRMMAAWDARGITLGYTVVSDLGDPITVPDGALEGIIANLAIRLNPHFNPQAPISQDVRDQAKVGMDAILSLCVDTAEVSYPETLPQGSGNTYPGYANNTFYPDDQGNILTETGGAIALEEDTEEA